MKLNKNMYFIDPNKRESVSHKLVDYSVYISELFSEFFTAPNSSSQGAEGL